MSLHQWTSSPWQSRRCLRILVILIGIIAGLAVSAGSSYPTCHVRLDRRFAPLWTRQCPVRLRGNAWRHLIIIDAGSSGTRVHMFPYIKVKPKHRNKRQGGTLPPQFEEQSTSTAQDTPITLFPPHSTRTKPGISYFSHNPSRVSEVITPLLKFAKARLHRSLWHQTPILLFATGGVRLLPPESQKKVLREATSVLEKSGFMFKPHWARVISGDEEAIYLWKAATFARDHMPYAASQDSDDVQFPKFNERNKRGSHSDGVIELGGASMQIAFPVSESLAIQLRNSSGSLSNFHSIHLSGEPLTIYTHSFSELGLIRAFDRMLMDQIHEFEKLGGNPCLPPDLNDLTAPSSDKRWTGLGNYKACVALIHLTLDSMLEKSPQTRKDLEQLQAVLKASDSKVDFVANENFGHIHQYLLEWLDLIMNAVKRPQTADECPYAIATHMRRSGRFASASISGESTQNTHQITCNDQFIQNECAGIREGPKRAVLLKIAEEERLWGIPGHNVRNDLLPTPTPAEVKSADPIDAIEVLKGHDGHALVSTLVRLGNRYCRQSSTTPKMFPDEGKAKLSHRCFGSAYIPVILRRVLGFSTRNRSNLVSANILHGWALQWALGAATETLIEGKLIKDGIDRHE